MTKADPHEADPTSIRNYTPEDFSLREDAEECDLVLKGGITSGVVYP